MLHNHQYIFDSRPTTTSISQEPCSHPYYLTLHRAITNNRVIKCYDRARRNKQPALEAKGRRMRASASPPYHRAAKSQVGNAPGVTFPPKWMVPLCPCLLLTTIVFIYMSNIQFAWLTARNSHDEPAWEIKCWAGTIFKTLLFNSPKTWTVTVCTYYWWWAWHDKQVSFSTAKRSTALPLQSWRLFLAIHSVKVSPCCATWSAQHHRIQRKFLPSIVFQAQPVNV